MSFRCQEYRVSNGWCATRYFKLGKGTKQGDLVPAAYLFTLVLEIIFLLIKENKKMRELVICNHTFYILHMQTTAHSF